MITLLPGDIYVDTWGVWTTDASVSVMDAGVWAAGTGVWAAGAGVSVTDTGVSATDAGVWTADAGVSVMAGLEAGEEGLTREGGEVRLNGVKWY